MSTKLASISWGSGPAIGMTFYYDARRSGADMQYKIYITVSAVAGASSFGYPIYLDVTLAGSTKVSKYTLKSASVSQWSSAITYESAWLTAADKVSGTAALKLRLYSGSGSTRDTGYSYSLPVVAAASTISSCADITAGGKCCVKWKPLSSSYYYKLKFSMGGFSHTETVGKAGTTNTFTYDDYTIPVSSVAYQLTAAVSGTMTATLYTYTGSGYDNLVGSDSDTFRVTLPTSVKPTAALTTSLNNSANSVIGGWGIAVKGYTRLSYNAGGSEGIYGSSIQSYAFSFAGQSKTAASGTTATITQSGALTPKVTVKDGRGRSDTKSAAAVTVYDYAKPTLSSVSVYRCDSAGAKLDNGAYLRVCANAACTALGGRNTVTLRVRSKTATSSYSGYTTLQSGTPAILGGYSPEVTYLVELSAVDSVGERKTVTVTVPTAKVALHLREGGSGAAFGKYSEKEALECAWNAYFEKNIYMAGKSIAPERLTGAFTADTTMVSNHNFTLRFIPAFGVVLLRGYAKLGDKALSANTHYTIGTIAQTYRPAQREALSAFSTRIANATIQTDGALRIALTTAVSAGSNYDIYITGYWFV